MLIINDLELSPYTDIWQQMKAFTVARNASTTDEVWLLEHPSVYTLGQAGKQEHVLNPKNIPVINSDRGGQVTYHGPGQLVAYFLLDLRRRNIGIRTLVQQLESLLISMLQEYDIEAKTLCGAPGVYVSDKKIASIGLRVKNGCTYHGIALNVNMDLEPFKGINPCGYNTLQMTQILDFVPTITIDEVKNSLSRHCMALYSKE
jgi:lipoyl(octanoyl) transferase